jgi:hypothetical protein
MGEDGRVIYRVVIDDSGVEDEAERAGRRAGDGVDRGARPGIDMFQQIAIGAMQRIGEAAVELAAKAGAAFVDMTKNAVSSVASLEQNVGGIETLFKESADDVIANAKRAYETAGLSANAYMETVTGFSASLLQSLGGDTQAAAAAADRAVVDMSDNANKMGTSMEAIQNAYQGFTKQNYTMLDNLMLGYGGTKGEMERLIADANAVKAANGEMANLSIESFADVTEAIHIIQTEMGITGATSAEASSTIEGSVNSAKAAYDNFLNGTISAEDFSEAIITAANNIANNLVVIVERFSTELPALVTALGNALPGMVQTIGPPLFEAVKGVIGALIGLLIDNIPNLAESGVELLVGMLTGFAGSGAAGQIMATVMTVIRALLNAIADNFPEILSAGFSIVVQIIKGLENAAGSLLGMAAELIMRLIRAFFTADWPSIGRNIVQGISNGIGGLWGSLIDDVKQSVNNLWESAKRALGIASPSKKFAYIGEMSVEGTMEGFEDTEAEMTRVVHDIYSGLPETASDALRPVDLSYTGYGREDIEQQVSYTLQATGTTGGTTIVVPLSLDGREIARATAWSMGEQLAWEEL